MFGKLSGLLCGLALVGAAEATPCAGTTILFDKCTSNGNLYVLATVTNGTGLNENATMSGGGNSGNVTTTFSCTSGQKGTCKTAVGSSSQNVTVTFNGRNPNPCTTTDTKNYSQINSTYGPPCAR